MPVIAKRALAARPVLVAAGLVLLAVAAVLALAGARMGGGTAAGAAAHHVAHHALRLLADGCMFHHTGPC